MSEKKYDEPRIGDGEKDVDYAIGDVHDTDRRKSSAVNPEILNGQLFDERYETTQRGLKSRYIPMQFNIHPRSNRFTKDTRR
jgi:amino acid transporter